MGKKERWGKKDAYAQSLHVYGGTTHLEESKLLIDFNPSSYFFVEATRFGF
jgi:hypothetical protein